MLSCSGGGSLSGGVSKSSWKAAASAGMGNSRTFRSSSMMVSYVGASAVKVFDATSATHVSANLNPHVSTVRHVHKSIGSVSICGRG